MKKRAFSKVLVFLLALVLMFTAMPNQVYAYLGTSREKATNIVSGTYTDELRRDMVYIQNDYISLHVVVGADSSAYEGSLLYTVPTAELTEGGVTNISRFGTQQMAFRVDEQVRKVKTDKAKYKEEKNVYTYESVIDKPYLLTVKDVTYSTDNKAGTLTINYKFTDDSITAKSVFSLVRYNEGMTNNSTSAFFETDEEFKASLANDPDGDSQSWGVFCQTEFACNKKDYHTDISLLTSFADYPKTGHSNADGSAHVYMNKVKYSNTYYSNAEPSSPRAFNNIDITGGMGETDVYNDVYHYTSEIFVDSYVWANPFVVVGGFANYIPKRYGLADEWYDYATNASYKNKILTTRVGSYTFCETEESSMVISGYVTSLWGYRDLKNSVEKLPEVTKRDVVIIPENAQYLAVVKNGSSYTVKPVATKAEADKLTGLVAALRGEYFYDSVNKRYVFNNGVQLSPSITASWSKGTGVYLGENGALTIDAANVSLNTPSFKFYAPKNGGYLKTSYSSDGIQIELDHGKNDAVVSLNIPNAICKLEEATIDTKGNLLFNGQFGIQSLFDNATFEMDKLSYSLKSGEMKVNGIHCKGKVGLSEAMLLGHGAANIEGEINTFSGQELYDFSLELKVGDLFESEAKLKLIRLNNGRLCPDDLSLFIKVTADGVGLDITPGTPVVTLKGGGGGISGLASTINGNYNAIPPVVLTLGVSGEVIKVVEGDLKLEIGPTKLRLSASDVGFKIGSSKVRAIETMEAGFFAEEKDLAYKGVKYSGYYFGGDAALGIKIFKIDEKDILYNTLGWFNGTVEAKFGVGVYGFIGENKAAKKVMAELGLLGNASAALKIPERIPVIGGTKLLGAALDFKLAGTSVMDSNAQTISNLFKHMNVTGGIVATASIIGISGRVIYLIPDKVSVKGKVWSEFEDWSWDDDEARDWTDGDNLEWNDPTNTASRTLLSAPVNTASTKLMGAPSIAYNNEGQEALVLTTFKGMPVNLAAVNPSNPGEYTETVITPDISKLGDGEFLILSVMPTDQSNFESFKNSLSITPATDVSGNDPLSSIALKYYDKEATTEEANVNANALIGDYVIDEKTGATAKAVVVSMPKSSIANSRSFTIKANGDFTLRGTATLPLTGLNASISGDKLTANVTAPESNTTYLLYTYYGSEKDSPEYLVDVREIGSDTTTVDLENNGLLAPNGNYYAMTYLVQETTLTTEGGQSETFELPIGNFCSNDACVTYTYASPVAAPTNVALELSGNETMTASWTGSATEGVSGYIVNLYQNDGTGIYIDTGRGYKQSLDNFKKNTNGLLYDSATDTYSIEMAVTVGGDGEALANAIDVSGNEINSSKALEADKDYKVCVIAYKDEVFAGVKCPSYSDGVFSEGKHLPAYQPVKINVNERMTGSLSKNADNMFECVVGNDGAQLSLSSDKDPNVTYSVTRLDNGEAVNGSWNQYMEMYSTDFFDFEGKVTYEIKASYTHDGVTDDTYEYVVISKDSVASVLTLEQTFFTADEEGNYTIKGVAGPNDTITGGSNSYINNYTGLEEFRTSLSATADENGNFTITGKLSENDEGEFESAFVKLTAEDAQNNISNSVSALVGPKAEEIEIPEIPVYEPEEPEDPEDPTDPTDPTDPEEPENPETPVNPTEPENPTPSNPTNPDPVTPSSTNTPEEPKNEGTGANNNAPANNAPTTGNTETPDSESDDVTTPSLILPNVIAVEPTIEEEEIIEDVIEEPTPVEEEKEPVTPPVKEDVKLPEESKDVQISEDKPKEKNKAGVVVPIVIGGVGVAGGGTAAGLAIRKRKLFKKGKK